MENNGIMRKDNKKDAKIESKKDTRLEDGKMKIKEIDERTLSFRTKNIVKDYNKREPWMNIDKYEWRELRREYLREEFDFVEREKAEKQIMEEIEKAKKEKQKEKTSKDKTPVIDTSKPTVYRLKCATFRRTIELHVGGDKEYFDKLFEGVEGLDYNDSLGVTGMHGHCHIVWLKGYSIGCLVHELTHVCQDICRTLGIKNDGEAIAYMYEEIFCQVWMQCGEYFKIDNEGEYFRFYLESNGKKRKRKSKN